MKVKIFFNTSYINKISFYVFLNKIKGKKLNQ